MRAMPGLIKDRHGTYYAQGKVPARLQEAVARVLNSEKPKQVFLKKSLGTKVFKEANVAATLVLADFNRILGSAEALLKERPVVPSLTDALIKRMAEFYYASLLAVDEEERQEGTGSEPIFQSVAAQLTAAGIAFNTPFKFGALPEAGLSDREVFKREHALAEDLPDAMLALAKGDITQVRFGLEELLDEFQVNLDPKSQSYRRLGMAVLAARVKALKDVARRNTGEPVDRHGVKDALRRGRVDVEAREALLGHSGSTSAVSRGYGASEMLERWGMQVLREAIAKIEYVGLDLSKVRTASFPGLDLSSVKPLRSMKRTRGTKVTR
ncbi:MULTISPECIES: DUF6538 domain-containing protein [unclassified Bradyrhizobium]|uniref:DUF6538 domain-containing protein n=1 Tax=unclassified Bradyrhizobium TaxID=2631580 RepID=UPI001FF98963|nr:MULTISPECIES: DUF6538 domain-containing protein [unclassified Bradyrhizobium]MCK1348660.1 hypothetical protein [Bradyrhizobium sp. CW11]MCK1702372.1 hypothetical protein [Bradyrhizobium sp. 146]